MRRPYDPRPASGIRLRGILVVPAVWVVLFGLLVTRAWADSGAWPHRPEYDSFPSPDIPVEPSADPARFATLYSLLYYGLLPCFAAMCLGWLLLLFSIHVRDLRVSSAWWAAFLISSALGYALVDIDLGGLWSWFLD